MFRIALGHSYFAFKYASLCAGIVILCLLSGCKLIEQDEIINDSEFSQYVVFPKEYHFDFHDTTSVYLDRNHPAIKAMQERAERISGIKWMPKGRIPKTGGGYLTEKNHSGIPYSSVKELDKFVGQEVSFQTFMSALNNPRSVLYTEHVNAPPYKGVNCASYYGTVCSMAVNYALGLSRPYESNMYFTLPFIKYLAVQDLNAATPGDILWKKGHVVLITDVLEGDGRKDKEISVLESNASGTSISQYSLTDLQKRWENENWILFRDIALNNAVDEIDPFLWDDSSLNYANEDLCLSRGNWVSYREGEDVTLNVLSPFYETVELIKDGSLIESRSYSGYPDIVFSGLSAGDYQINLSGAKGVSKAIAFEVLHTQVSAQEINKWLKVSFNSSNAVPEYVVLCDEIGARSFISDLTAADISRGYLIIKCEKSLKGLYAKVFFKGKYGRVSNAIIPLK